MQAVDTGRGTAASMTGQEASKQTDSYGLQALTDRVQALAGQVTATANKKKQRNKKEENCKPDSS